MQEETLYIVYDAVAMERVTKVRRVKCTICQIHATNHIFTQNKLTHMQIIDKLKSSKDAAICVNLKEENDMKMTKVLACVLAMALLVAMAAFSASAAERYYLQMSEANVLQVFTKATDASCMNAEVVEDGDGMTIELLADAPTTGGIPYAFAILNADMITAMPYLVLEIEESSTMNYNFAGWDEDLQGVYPFDGEGISAETGRFVFNLRENGVAEGQTFTCQLWTTGTAGDKFIYKLYLTDDPDASTAGGGAETGAESAVAVAVAAVLGAGALLAISRKK